MEHVKELIKRYQSGQITEEERLQLEHWFHHLNKDEALVLEDPEFLELKQEMWTEIVRQAPEKRVVKLWPRIVAVAAAVAMVVFGVWFFSVPRHPDAGQDPGSAQYATDVAPGSVGATLTLASGKKIRLSDAANGELAKEAGVSITKSADGQLVYEIKGSESDPNKMNTLSTARGETYQVRLPDGSMVFLNAASSLTYAASLFERGKRTVRLRGEGYFEVFKDKQHPFVVQTDKQEVEVLGTHFNINAYEDEQATATTLLEGSVRVAAFGKTTPASPPLLAKEGTILKPNQQSVVSGSNRIQVQEVDVNQVVSWKDGYFRFNDEKLSSIMKKLERWYDVEIELSDKLSDVPVSGKIARNRNISAVLRMMEKTNSIYFKIEGRRIIAIEK
jgi:ferric-dicitrate binding protein FerR (iron transport regulator)